MNYLAHLFLSCQDDDLVIGNFIADSIKNKEISSFSTSIQQGIYLHRQIDSFTDKHPIVKRGTQRLHVHHHKYAPVVMDIYFDNLLAHNWKRYSDESISDFAQRMYRILTERQLDLPLKMQKYVPNMIANDWLQKYGTFEGLQYTFERMDRRTRFPSNFKNAVRHLKDDFTLFNEEFNLFFPDVQQMVFEFCGC